MPNHPQDLEGFDRRIEFTRWPEWEQELPGATLQKPTIVVKYRLRKFARCVREINANPAGDGQWAWNAYLTDHEAASLISTRFDEVLDEHRTWLAPIFDDAWQVCRFRAPACQVEYLCKDGTWSILAIHAKSYASRHKGQAAAIDSLTKEMGDEK